MQTLAQITVTPTVSDATNFSLAMQPALGRSNQIFVATALTYNPATGILTLPGTIRTGSITTTGTVGIGTSFTSSYPLSVVGGTLLSGSATAPSLTLNNMTESVSVNAAVSWGGNITVYLSNSSVVYYTAPATANWNVNIGFSSATSLGSVMSVGQAISMAFIATTGTTAYYTGNVTVDGSNLNVLTLWQGNVTPTSGHVSSADIYNYTVIKTAATPAYTVLASQSQY